jgi:hypothetical protein
VGISITSPTRRRRSSLGMPMKLPPVDELREPFIVPLGHLVLQAALTDEAVISLCSVIPFDGSPEQMSPCQAAHNLRNWNKSTEAFLEERLALIVNEEWSGAARHAIGRYKQLRDYRHRAIHDAIVIGQAPGDVSSLTRTTLSVAFTRTNGTTEQHIRAITPEAVALLALEFSGLRIRIERITAGILNSH